MALGAPTGAVAAHALREQQASPSSRADCRNTSERSWCPWYIRIVRRPFISYAREDYEIALRLHDDLHRAGLSPWLDRKMIRGGEDWRAAIGEGLRSATHVIALISRHSVNKRGYVQNELRRALELLEDMPPGQIYIIPVRLDQIEPNHARLNDLQWIDLFEGYEDSFEKILQSLRATSPSTVTPITQPDIGNAAALIAHEIANSLGFFNVYLNIIREEAGGLERVTSSIDVLERSVNRTLAFVRDIRSLAQPDRLPRKKLDIAMWLTEIEPELRAIAGDKITLEVKNRTSYLPVSANRDALERVLTNLVANAAQAIDESGKIIVMAEAAASLAAGSRSVVVSVADSGHGIEPKYFDRIFDAFFTTKSHGTGVGLAVVRNIVRAHGGEVEVQSNVGRGTTFFVYLPMSEN